MHETKLQSTDFIFLFDVSQLQKQDLSSEVVFRRTIKLFKTSC